MIRHSNGAWLPAITSKQAATISESTTSRPPRLFLTKSAAERFLTLWAKGPLVGRWENESDSIKNGLGDRIKRGWKTDPDPNNPRNRGDFTIHKMELRPSDD